jgi:hypothetical protein
VTGFFVRKEAKKHGLGKQIEGGFAAGQSVALVEDTMTTGGSTLEALEAVTAAGAKVARVLCIVDRGEGAADAFRAQPRAQSIFTRRDLPDLRPEPTRSAKQRCPRFDAGASSANHHVSDSADGVSIRPRIRGRPTRGGFVGTRGVAASRWSRLRFARCNDL